MEKSQRNSSLTLREGIMEKRLSQLQIGEGKFLSDFKLVNKAPITDVLDKQLRIKISDSGFE